MPELVRRDVLFGMCSLDVKGRVFDGRVIAALGWSVGTRVGFTVVDGLIVIGADEAAPYVVSGRGSVRLPMNVRRAVGIESPQRVLLAALPGPGRLVVHPLVMLEHWSATVHAAVSGGGS
ncbi:AbrB/MazE/SpoVT family DNA-binding domain-containing protein [Nucisporomicrobium flavum]|uniref:AbrB/MazE/SpoVT family DNA-binding domain-containing protein n=1 Tax=Nucisporomicrobium flavum TaxID=2785915 RepID=UPI0018F6902F|nr:AbrB/MazE/SpoVT family DNA-binding domain-containing protein [Nucisporomicrobium flavum]